MEPISTEPRRNAVRTLPAEVARKIAAGEVIDRPNAIVRELLDNAVDSGATDITVEITGGGIEKIRVIDNGCGMTQDDLRACARPHATSKISTADDLLSLSTLGFRGEALASMAAVSRLEIISGGWKLSASVTEDHVLTPAASARGTIVQTAGLFENFPARRQFLKRAASEGALCRATFEEKAIPRPDIAFSLVMDGEQKSSLPAGQSLTERFVQALGLFEGEQLFYEVTGHDPGGDWSFTVIIGEPSVTRSTRKNLYTYVNGRRIQDYSFMQAIEYGGQGYFPNGLHPVACLLITIRPSLVDFNIHPAKREARFKDSAPLHHAISTATRNFFRQYTVRTMVPQADAGTAPESPADGTPDDGSLFVHSPAASLASPQAPRPRYQAGGIPSSGASYSHVKRDKRSSFLFGTPQQESPWRALAEAAANPPEDASVPGRTTHPNHLPDAQGEQDGVRFVGAALGNFLIAEKDDVLYLIDQHAAHERYLYDRIMEEAGKKQALLVPYTVRTESAADEAYLAELAPKLEQAGFTGHARGDGTWEFSTVPVRWKGTEQDLARDLLDRRIQPHDLINAVAASTACRTAVMDGDVLDSGMAAWLCAQALRLPDPHCPHGRPAYVTITRRQLFTLVKRL